MWRVWQLAMAGSIAALVAVFAVVVAVVVGGAPQQQRRAVKAQNIQFSSFDYSTKILI